MNDTPNRFDAGPVVRLPDVREMHGLGIVGDKVSIQWSTASGADAWAELNMPKHEAVKLLNWLLAAYKEKRLW